MALVVACCTALVLAIVGGHCATGEVGFLPMAMMYGAFLVVGIDDIAKRMVAP